MRSRPLALATALGGLAIPWHAAAQTEVALEVGASQVGPATGFDVQATNARFAIGGVRVSTFSASGTGLYGSFLGGQVFGDSTGGSFMSGVVEATVREPWSTHWTGSMDLKVFGFGVRDPFPYRTIAAEMGPSLHYRSTSASVRLGLLAGLGRSHVELFRRADGPRLILDDNLWRVGSTAELLVGSPTVQVGLAGSSHKTVGDLYNSFGGRFVVGGDWGVAELRVDRWDTPDGFETTGGLSLAIPLGRGWSLRGFLGRSDPDPLTLAQPGSGSGGAILGWNVYSSEGALPERKSPFEIVEYTDAGGRVRITVTPPGTATAVRLVGDFTLWDEVEMTRAGTLWIAELTVPPGTHHYGFLVDGEWYVPEDASDVVPDEWGRLSAILVIEGAGS